MLASQYGGFETRIISKDFGAENCDKDAGRDDGIKVLAMVCSYVNVIAASFAVSASSPSSTAFRNIHGNP